MSTRDLRKGELALIKLLNMEDLRITTVDKLCEFLLLPVASTSRAVLLREFYNYVEARQECLLGTQSLLQTIARSVGATEEEVDKIVSEKLRSVTAPDNVSEK